MSRGPARGAKADQRLRIIAGTWRGRMIAAPADMEIRPTAARAREALFNRLVHGFSDYGFALADARVVDIFAGSGVLGLEALSRGAAHAAFIDQAPEALTLIRRNIETLGADDRTAVIGADARSLPRASRPCDLAFLDPPYGQGLVAPALTGLAAQGWLRPGALVSIETGDDETISLPDGFTEIDHRSYGRATLAIAQYR